MHNFKPGYIEADEGEQTLKVTQETVKHLVNVQTAANMFDLNLTMGRYRCQYSQNGSNLLLTSSMGHAAIMNWREKELQLEFNITENILQSQFLHND